MRRALIKTRTVGSEALLRRSIAICSLVVSTAAMAQVVQPVRLIVPFATGGGTDMGARIIAPHLAQLMDRPVIVENKPGASGAIGTAQVASAPADGMTILVGTSSSMGSSPIASPNLPYDVLRDFSAVGAVHIGHSVLVVHPSVPANTLQELIVYARANPGKITYGSSGLNSTYHFGTELFATRAGVVMTHVPYKGASAATQDLVAGHIQLMMDAVFNALPYIRSGKVKALAVVSATRDPSLPEVPTLAESGVTGCEYSNWIGLFVPARTPPQVVSKINADLNTVLRYPEVKEKFAKFGVQPAPGSPADLETMLRSDHAKWTRLMQEARIKPE